MKILAVDDSVDTLNMIRDALTSVGHQVDIAENGADALAKYFKVRPDIVTLDVTMPLMSGHETLTRIIKFDPNAKVIMLTASDHWLLVEACLVAGAVGYLSKPFRINDLIETVTNPFRYDDKNAAIIFSVSRNKIKSSMETFFGTTLVKLHSVEVIRQKPSGNVASSNQILDTVRVINSVSKHIQLSASSHTGYVTEFLGGIRGMIISFIKPEHVEQTKNVLSDTMDSFDMNEFIHIINSKIFSTVADFHRTPAEMQPLKNYDATTEEALPRFFEQTRAKIEIVSDKLTFPMEINIILDQGSLVQKIQ